ncbi:MAG: zinc ABC transporter substrate-binding protein [Ignisphaera sp.]
MEVLKQVSIIILLLSMLIAPYTTASNGNGLVVVVTFPFLYNDVKKLVCQGDSVLLLVKPGIDPHEYQLTPSDIDTLKVASLVISTAHAPFELQIEKLVASGELNAALVEITKIPGIIFLKHPQTGQINYHAVIFYPKNYEVFIKYVENFLETLRPECSNVYRENAKTLLAELTQLTNNTRRLSGYIAVIDTPPIQYVAAWLDLNISYILLRDEETPVTPQDYQNVENIIKTSKNVVVLVTQGSTASSKLEEMARTYGKPFVELPNPLVYNGTLDYLEKVSQIINNANLTTKTSVAEAHTNLYTITTIIAISILVIALVVFAVKKRVV